MEQKEFITVYFGDGSSAMISISSIAFVRPNNIGCIITLKESVKDGLSLEIITHTAYGTIVGLIQNYRK